MRLYNFSDRTNQKIYGNNFFRYLNSAQQANALKQNVIQLGGALSISGVQVIVGGGAVSTAPVAIPFVMDGTNTGANAVKISCVADYLGTTLDIAEGTTQYIIVRVTSSSTTPKQEYYDMTGSVMLVTSLTPTFPTGNIMGEVVLGTATRLNSVVTVDYTLRDIDYGLTNVVTYQAMATKDFNCNGLFTFSQRPLIGGSPAATLDDIKGIQAYPDIHNDTPGVVEMYQPSGAPVRLVLNSVTVPGNSVVLDGNDGSITITGGGLRIYSN